MSPNQLIGELALNTKTIVDWITEIHDLYISTS